MKNSELVSAHDQSHDFDIPASGGVPVVTVGQWVWVDDEDKVWNRQLQQYDVTPCRWLGCVIHFGSNYVEVASPQVPGNSKWSVRIHTEQIAKRLSGLSDAQVKQIIEGKIDQHRTRSSQLMDEVRALSARLGLASVSLPSAGGAGHGGALASLASRSDVDHYKGELVVAKEQTLPQLFEQIKESNKQLTRWLTASTLPMQVMVGGMAGLIAGAEDRIFNISLYAGLAESVKQCCEGAPASLEDKLHVMQRRCYMDEECLANYRVGGMQFDGIDQFDAWLCEPENRDRILPFPRTIVAMRVRRNSADRVWDGTLMGAFINMKMGELDRLTFLYIRNGEQVWRLSTDIEFGEKIFPDKGEFDPSEPMMVKIYGGRVDKLMSRREWESRSDQLKREMAACEQWKLQNPFDQWVLEHPGGNEFRWEYANPYRVESGGFEPSHWSALDFSNVHLDDAMDAVAQEVKRYNRIATVIQGLFDRSLVLHPHRAVRAWTHEGFEQAIDLVYDASEVLNHGQAPDFEAYRARCNDSLGVGSVVIGQREYWLAREAEKEMVRRRGDMRLRESERYMEIKQFKPFGNPGPSEVEVVAECKRRVSLVTFRWLRGRASYRAHDDGVPCSLSVPFDNLFNISAYRPGDFKQFFKDSRTRAQYLKWAPVLLAAEEWWAANPQAAQEAPGPQ